MCLVVYLDISAAFNCLKHFFLFFLQMLEHLGCDPPVVARFGSYLSDRKQAVKVGNVESGGLTLINIGTPLDSILGPYVFIVLMINFVLLKISAGNYCKVVTYANDTSPLFRISPESIRTNINAAVSRVEKVISPLRSSGSL